jgi:putative oxidoreductase
VVAGSVHWGAGLWAQKGGYELPFFYITAAIALAFSGPGKYSLDNALGLQHFAGNVWGVAAVLAGSLSGLTMVARGRRVLAADTTAQKVTPAHA